MRKILIITLTLILLSACSTVSTNAGRDVASNEKILNLKSAGTYICSDEVSLSKLEIVLWEGKAMHLMEIVDGDIFFKSSKFTLSPSNIWMAVDQTPLGAVASMNLPKPENHKGPMEIMFSVSKIIQEQIMSMIAVVADGNEEAIIFKCAIKN